MLAAPGDSGPSGWVVVGALGVNKKGSEKLVREIPWNINVWEFQKTEELPKESVAGNGTYSIDQDKAQARNQDFMWGGANEAKVDQTTEMYFLLSDPFT